MASIRFMIQTIIGRILQFLLCPCDVRSYVSEHAAYHHGEASLAATIVGMGQTFVGSNNINLLYPAGQFGTRLMGGKDAASARYIFTRLSNIARSIFRAEDDPLLTYEFEDGQKIEPEVCSVYLSPPLHSNGRRWYPIPHYPVYRLLVKLLTFAVWIFDLFGSISGTCLSSRWPWSTAAKVSVRAGLRLCPATTRAT